MYRLYLPILICCFCLPDSVFGQAKPYVSAFESYQHTTDSLLSNSGVSGATLPASLVARPINQANGKVIYDAGPFCGSPVEWPATGHSGTISDEGPYHGHSVMNESTPVWAGPEMCQTCEPCQEVICESCCSSPCDERGRTFAVNTSAVFLFRESPSAQRLFFNPGVAAENIDASHFSLGMAPGYESSVLWYDKASAIDFEAKAMWVNDWDSQVNQTFTGASVQIAADPILGTTGPRDGAALYSSQFGNLEVNARYRVGQGCNGTTLVGGFRYIRLNERLNATLSDPAGIVPDELIRVRTENDVYGIHWGVDSIVANTERCCVTLLGRVGLMGNRMDQQTQMVSLSSPVVTFTADGDAGDLAWLAELGFTGKFRLTSCANLTAGYRAIFLDGVALAPEQLGASSFLTNTGLHTNGSLLLHAATVGLEVAY